MRTVYEYFTKIVALPRKHRPTEVSALPAAVREEVCELLRAREELELEQEGRAQPIVDQLSLELSQGNHDAELDAYLVSPEVADWYRVEFFKKLLKVERDHRKVWNSSHSQCPQLPLHYGSYWRRKWFHEGNYGLATIAVLIDDHCYTLVEEIGKGGMGRVLLVRDRSAHNKSVALKVVNAEALVNRLDESDRRKLLSRFDRESRVLSTYAEDNLPTLYRVGDIDGLRYFTMQYVPGPTLDGLVTGKGPWSEDQVISYMVPVARLVDKIHRNPELHHEGDRWIHRDLHPKNFILDDTKNRVFLIDFGLARPIKAPSTSDITDGEGGGRKGYCPPEQRFDLSAADERSDVFTFGATLYFLLTQRAPGRDGQLGLFPVDSPMLWNSIVTEKMATVLLKALEKEPDSRFQTMAELAAALNGCAQTQLTPAPDAGENRPARQQTGDVLRQPNGLVSAFGDRAAPIPDRRSWRSALGLVDTRYWIAMLLLLIALGSFLVLDKSRTPRSGGMASEDKLVAPSKNGKESQVLPGGRNTQKKLEFGITTFIGYAPLKIAEKKLSYWELKDTTDNTPDEDEERIVNRDSTAFFSTLDMTINKKADLLRKKSEARHGDKHGPSCILLTSYSEGADAIIAAHDVKEIKDLKDRVVATVAGTCAETVLRYHLEVNEIKAKKIEYVSRAAELVQRFGRGEFAAIAVWSPYREQAEQYGRMLVQTGKKTTSPEIYDVLFVHKKEDLYDNKEAFKELLEAWDYGVDQIRKEGKDTIKELSDWLKCEPTEVSGMVNKVTFYKAADIGSLDEYKAIVNVSWEQRRKAKLAAEEPWLRVFPDFVRELNKKNAQGGGGKNPEQ